MRCIHVHVPEPHYELVQMNRSVYDMGSTIKAAMLESHKDSYTM